MMQQDDPMMILIDAMSESMAGRSSSNAILNQEARGQRKLVNADVLPRECPRAALESLGFVFGKEVDSLFVEVNMPSGWRKEATDHSMWSNLVDPQGRKRGSIFYKAAFYDRTAHMHLSARYSYHNEPVLGWDNSENSQYHAVVKDCGQPIWHTEQIEAKPSGDNREELMAWYARKDKLDNQAAAYLDENYPDWRNPLAYWD